MSIYIPKWLIKFILTIIAIILFVKIVSLPGALLILVIYIYIKTKSNKNNENKSDEKSFK